MIRWQISTQWPLADRRKYSKNLPVLLIFLIKWKLNMEWFYCQFDDSHFNQNGNFKFYMKSEVCWDGVNQNFRKNLSNGNLFVCVCICLMCILFARSALGPSFTADKEESVTYFIFLHYFIGPQCRVISVKGDDVNDECICAITYDMNVRRGRKKEKPVLARQNINVLKIFNSSSWEPLNSVRREKERKRNEIMQRNGHQQSSINHL